MKLIHCADIHLDSRMQTHMPERQASARNAEITKTFLRWQASFIKSPAQSCRSKPFPVRKIEENSFLLRTRSPQAVSGSLIKTYLAEKSARAQFTALQLAADWAY